MKEAGSSHADTVPPEAEGRRSRYWIVGHVFLNPVCAIPLVTAAAFAFVYVPYLILKGDPLGWLLLVIVALLTVSFALEVLKRRRDGRS